MAGQDSIMKSTLVQPGGLPASMVQKRHRVDPDKLLTAVSQGKVTLQIRARQTVFAQGDASDGVFYIRKGNVKLTVLSSSGKEATVGLLGEGDFFGEASLAGQAFRMESAISLTNCTIVRIEKKAMLQALHRDHEFSDMFVGYVLARNIRYEEDLVDQLFNSSEKRLVRILLLLARFDQDNNTDHVVPKISQATLAGMVGTTRSRINFFMNKFRKQGYIDYEDGLTIRSSLLKVLLED